MQKKLIQFSAKISIRSYIKATVDDVLDLLIEFSEIFGGGVLSIASQKESFTDYYFQIYMNFYLDNDYRHKFKDENQAKDHFMFMFYNFLEKKYMCLEAHKDIVYEEFYNDYKKDDLLFMIKEMIDCQTDSYGYKKVGYKKISV